MTYGFLPFAILPLFVSIDRLDHDLVAAARDLYASGRAAFLHVTLPLTMPGIIAAAHPDVHPGDRRLRDAGPARRRRRRRRSRRSSRTLFLVGRDWPYGAALGFLLMIVTLGGTLVALRTCGGRSSADADATGTAG